MSSTTTTCVWHPAAAVPPPADWARWMIQSAVRSSEFRLKGGYGFIGLCDKPLVGIIFQPQPFAVWLAWWNSAEIDSLGAPAGWGPIVSLAEIPANMLRRLWKTTRIDLFDPLLAYPSKIVQPLRHSIPPAAFSIMCSSNATFDVAAQMPRMVAAAGQPARQLIFSNPPLAELLLAPQLAEAPFTAPSDWWAEMFLLPQHEILEFLGFPLKKSLPRLMRRMDWRVRDSLHLRLILRRDPKWMRILEPLGPLPPRILHLMQDCGEDRMETSYLRQVIKGFSLGHPLYGRLFSHTAQCRLWLEHVPPGSRIRSDQKLGAILDALEEIELQQPFPPPPVPEGENIKAVATPGRLRELSKSMRHCGWQTFRREVHSAAAYFYQYGETPAGLTLLLQNQGGWELVEVRGYRNRDATMEELEIVTKWALTRGVKVSMPRISWLGVC